FFFPSFLFLFFFFPPRCPFPLPLPLLPLSLSSLRLMLLPLPLPLQSNVPRTSGGKKSIGRTSARAMLSARNRLLQSAKPLRLLSFHLVHLPKHSHGKGVVPAVTGVPSSWRRSG